MREVAAYLLDRDGFANVPTSVLVRARHPIFCYNSVIGSVRASTADFAMTEATAMLAGAGFGGNGALPMKLGSLQEFVPHECDTTEMGPSKFCAKDVHHIGILVCAPAFSCFQSKFWNHRKADGLPLPGEAFARFPEPGLSLTPSCPHSTPPCLVPLLAQDIRLFNTDRHAGNMLVRSLRDTGSTVNLLARLGEPQYALVPIDHGFCLPETLEAPYFEWLHWPQVCV